MKAERLVSVVAVIAALHVAVLSYVIGLRHLGYMLTATLSAAGVWGGLYLLGGRRRRWGIIVGVMLALVVQQVSWQVWNVQLSEFWWPVAQFGALQFLVACGVNRVMSGIRRTQLSG